MGKVEPTAAQRGAFAIVDEVASTSEALKRRAEAGAPECALMARRQTAGRGRLGRAWISEAGNLHLSVLVRPGRLSAPGHWSLLAAVALAEVLAGHAPPGAVRLKWPNDVMLGPGKLAGVLLETGQDGGPWLVIGFGANLVTAPAGLGRPTACLGPGAPVADLVATEVMLALSRWRFRYEAEGFGPVRAAWLALGPPHGASLTAGALIGTFVGLGDDGALLLDTATGVVAVWSGEVSFGS